MRAASLALASLVVVLGVACGGGGGPGKPTYDNVLEIVERSPAAGDANVLVGVPFTARFSRPLDPSTVIDGNVQVSGNGGVPLAKTLSLSDDKQTLSIKLLAAPTLPASVTVAFQGLRDILGDAVPHDQWSFSMPEWWEPFGTPPVINWNMNWDSMVLDGEGHPVVAGYGPQGVYVARWDAGTWTRMGATLTRGGESFYRTALAVRNDPASGQPRYAVVWQERTRTSATSLTQSAYVALWNGTEWRDALGGSVATAKPVVSSDARADPPILMFDRQGVLHLTVPGPTETAWRLAPNGTTWTPLGTINKDPNHAVMASLADTSVGPVVVWTEQDNTYVSALLESSIVPLAGPLNASGHAAQFAAVAGSKYPVIAYVDLDSAASTYAVKVLEYSGIERSLCGDAVLEDPTTRPIGLALTTDGDGMPWVAVLQTGHLRLVHCGEFTANVEGTIRSDTVNTINELLSVSLAAPHSIPTIAYVDYSSGADAGPDFHFRIKQPNR